MSSTFIPLIRTTLLDVLSAFDERRQASRKIILGDPPTEQPGQPKDASKSASELDIEQHGRHLLKHIFPRQYGMRSVFTVYRVREAPTWRMKEMSIAVGVKNLHIHNSYCSFGIA